MVDKPKRNRLLPWFIGLAVIVLADLWIAYQMFCTACQAPGFVQALVVIVVPGIYLVLMYITFKSQD
jgi:hypothetical protein